MSITCSICDDEPEDSKDFYTTRCGHLFHHECLVHWIKRSKTCPICQSKVTVRTIHRIFPEFTNNVHIVDHADTLENLNKLEIQLQKRQDYINSLKNENVTLQERITELEDTLKMIQNNNKFIISLIIKQNVVRLQNRSNAQHFINKFLQWLGKHLFNERFGSFNGNFQRTLENNNVSVIISPTVQNQAKELSKMFATVVQLVALRYALKSH